MSKSWCFTLNNPLIDSIPLAWGCAYVVYQKEKAASGTLHLQGYAEFSTRKKLDTLKKVCGEAHWEPRHGTQAQAIAYCQKEDTRVAGPWEQGTKLEDEVQGQRNDLISLKTDIESGMPMLEVTNNNYYAMSRYHKFALWHRSLMNNNMRKHQTTVEVFWGKPDTGKTTHVQKIAGDNAFWVRQPQHNGALWWDGYDGNEVVVIDEFYGWLPRTLMQRLIDHTPLMLDTKGGAVNFIAKKIYIVSNAPPSEWWKVAGLGPAMERRLKEPIGKVTEIKYPMWLPSPPESAVAPQAVDTVYAPHRKAAQQLLAKYGVGHNEITDHQPEEIQDSPPEYLGLAEPLPLETVTIVEGKRRRLGKRLRIQEEEEEESPSCFQCGEQGHWARECTTNPDN